MVPISFEKHVQAKHTYASGYNNGGQYAVCMLKCKLCYYSLERKKISGEEKEKKTIKV